MSSSIWTRCGGVSNLELLVARPYRAVESQYLISTRKLTDSDEEQAVLEDLLDRSKPPVGDDVRGLHYLLFTPFRYPPLRHGSRFGTRTERGIWYGSETLRACFAEVAYYRLVFLEGTRAELSPLFVELTTFRAHLRTKRGVDLTKDPFDWLRARISSRTRYHSSQTLGREMRAAEVEAARYRSARDREGGTNVAVFSPQAFSSKKPQKLEAWLVVATRDSVEISKKEFRRRRPSMRFVRTEFEVGGRLPQPATT